MASKTTDPRAECESAEGARKLLRADAVRTSAQRMLAVALDGDLEDWTVDLDRLTPTAEFVARVVRERYPRLDVPVHSRWRHFLFGSRDLWDEIAGGANWKSAEAQARSAFDLVITSVLLDAGAGAKWRYHDRATGLIAARSEGLALASLRWFERGELSVDPGEPYRADAAALRRVDHDVIQGAFQAGEGNRLPGLEGRAALLNRLGAVLDSRPDLFAISDSPRPGGLFDALSSRALQRRLPAATIFETLLEALSPIWEARPTLSGVPLGDCWPHPALTGDRPEDAYVALHKLSQWLTYSLIEPLENAGISVSGVSELTGLAEYRNGGLLDRFRIRTRRHPSREARHYAGASPNQTLYSRPSENEYF